MIERGYDVDFLDRKDDLETSIECDSDESMDYEEVMEEENCSIEESEVEI